MACFWQTLRAGILSYVDGTAENRMPQDRPEQRRPQKLQDELSKLQSEITELRQAIALKEKELQQYRLGNLDEVTAESASDRRWRTRGSKRRWLKRQ